MALNAGTPGGARRVTITGMADTHTKIAASANSTKPAGEPSVSNCWPNASAPRLHTMYTANTLPRCAGSAWPLSQLSMVMYRPTSAMPVMTRSAIHSGAEMSSTCPNAQAATAAVKKANARTWPMDATSRGHTRVPTRKPPK